MTTPADYVIDHNAGRHRKYRDAHCSLCVNEKLGDPAFVKDVLAEEARRRNEEN